MLSLTFVLLLVVCLMSVYSVRLDKVLQRVLRGSMLPGGDSDDEESDDEEKSKGSYDIESKSSLYDEKSVDSSVKSVNSVYPPGAKGEQEKTKKEIERLNKLKRVQKSSVQTKESVPETTDKTNFDVHPLDPSKRIPFEGNGKRNSGDAKSDESPDDVFQETFQGDQSGLVITEAEEKEIANVIEQLSNLNFRELRDVDPRVLRMALVFGVSAILYNTHLVSENRNEVLSNLLPVIGETVESVPQFFDENRNEIERVAITVLAPFNDLEENRFVLIGDQFTNLIQDLSAVSTVTDNNQFNLDLPGGEFNNEDALRRMIALFLGYLFRYLSTRGLLSNTNFLNRINAFISTLPLVSQNTVRSIWGRNLPNNAASAGSITGIGLNRVNFYSASLIQIVLLVSLILGFYSIIMFSTESISQSLSEGEYAAVKFTVASVVTFIALALHGVHLERDSEKMAWKVFKRATLITPTKVFGTWVSTLFYSDTNLPVNNVGHLDTYNQPAISYGSVYGEEKKNDAIEVNYDNSDRERKNSEDPEIKPDHLDPGRSNFNSLPSDSTGLPYGFLSQQNRGPTNEAGSNLDRTESGFLSDPKQNTNESPKIKPEYLRTRSDSSDSSLNSNQPTNGGAPAKDDIETGKAYF